VADGTCVGLGVFDGLESGVGSALLVR